MSYTIEVYRGTQAPERNPGIFALYVMFYPQLVAGPIERPQTLLHQFHKEHRFEYHRVVAGLQLMVWGLFKKIVVADRLAKFVNSVYDQPRDHSGLSLIVATWAFAFQIFCDFSGYSDIAIGSARVMGFDLMQNFRQPYIARSVAEFWKRWHISLSTWFRDYLYIPLGGNRVGAVHRMVNVLIVFLVSGLWHGANWTFVIWGGLNGLAIVLGSLTAKWRDYAWQAAGFAKESRFRSVTSMFLTFNLICLAWVFFRARTVSDAFYIVSHLVPHSLVQDVHALTAISGGLILGLIALLIVVTAGMQVIQERFQIRAWFESQPSSVRWLAYYAALAGILLFVDFRSGQQFIYFQF